MINDSNESLVNVYRVIQNSPEELIKALDGIQREYHALAEHADRRAYFMERRTFFNEGGPDDVTRAALFIFFMRTCYNGIYSVNRSGKLSVTFGAGNRAKILEEDLLRLNHKLLQGVVILDGDYRRTAKYAGEKTFFTLIHLTSRSTSRAAAPPYMPDDFDDHDQIRLAEFCRDLGNAGSK